MAPGVALAPEVVGQRLTLVVVSKTLLAGWIDEIEKAFGKDFPYEILHRSYLKRGYDTWEPKKSTRLVLTTPDVLIDAYKAYGIDGMFLNHRVPVAFGPVILDYKPSPTPFIRTAVGPGYVYKIVWGNIIIDEIQRHTEITTAKCQAIGAVCSTYRWGLSGTMFDEPKQSRILGFIVMLHLKGPRCLPDMAEFLKTFGGLNKYLIKRDTNTEFDPPEYVEEIVSHPLEPIEALIFTEMKTIVKTISKHVKASKARGDSVGTRLYSAYMLALITYLRQSLICPLIPITSMHCDMGDFQARSELSAIVMDHFKTIQVDAYLEDEKSIVSSRFKAVLSKLGNHCDTKCVVFSSFRSVTDLLMYCIEQTGRPTLTISAGMSIAARRKVIADFEASENTVLVIPYDIGAEGLNLQCASVVFLVDLWWNSAKTDQAIGRVFRPGQKAAKINVYIFVSDTYIEQEIIKKNAIKETMLTQLQNGATDLKIPKIDMAQIMNLIGVDENDVAITSFRQMRI